MSELLNLSNLAELFLFNLYFSRKIVCMNFEQLNFSVFCIGSLADALHMNNQKVYHLLKDSGILTGCIIPCYDVLHTLSKEYIVEDLVSFMKEKGVLQ